MARSRRKERGRDRLQKKSDIDPLALDEAQRQYNRGMHLQQLGQFSQAESAYRRSIALNPSFPGSHNNLGNVLKDRGKFRLAEKAYRRALELAPDHPLLVNNIGNVWFLQQRYPEAEAMLERALRFDPDNFQARSNLGNVLMALDRPAEAIKNYQRALEIDSSVPELFANLGMALNDQERFHQACQCLEKAVQLSPDNADYHAKLGHILGKMNLLDEAERENLTACELAPKEPRNRFNYAFALVSKGLLPQAVEQLRFALSLDDTYAEAHWGLALLCDHTHSDDDVRAMEHLLCKKNLSIEQKACLAFGLGKAYDDMNAHAEAFDWFSRANTLARQAAGFDIETATTTLRRVIAYFSRHRKIPVGEKGHPDSTPFFVTGMSRSGKSLVEQMLCLHPSVAPRGETGILRRLVDDLGAAAGGKDYPALLEGMDASSCVALAKEYVRQLRADRLEQAHITDTHPNNANYIGLVRRCLPEAKIIVCRRAAADACISIFQKNYAKGHGYSNDLTDLGRSWSMYERMLDLWHELFPETVYQVSFEALVRSPEEEARSLLAFCGIPCDDDYLERVRVLANDPRRWPKPEEVIDVWRPYEAYLSPLFAALEEQDH